MVVQGTCAKSTTLAVLTIYFDHFGHGYPPKPSVDFTGMLSADRDQCTLDKRYVKTIRITTTVLHAILQNCCSSRLSRLFLFKYCIMTKEGLRRLLKIPTLKYIKIRQDNEKDY